MKHTLLPALCQTLCLALCLTGCAADTGDAYDPEYFACTLAIDSVSTGGNGYYLADCARMDGETVLTVTVPERLAGLSFAFTQSGCVMDAARTAVPLSTDAAASLTGLMELLSADPDTASDRKKTADGTVLFFPAGQLTLDAGGIPILAETTDGRRAAVQAFHPADSPADGRSE